ncbi:hypothetical protein TRFO_09855 [Tritrichomonas foetus]|uniref:TFIID subunit TAF5 NTD2 domain-containing protein n=1 Tax=Tritrichomonas foetus TaxID=1144522 RepID=A0A1J4JBW5_9EUKA|nr:hypothetical protein TRFO_09855 [Tritrichomonas foetus]|eukprot:OHS96690.1 hypothetical protein TRFO_09855 [Tritrichomonas foetus]
MMEVQRTEIQMLPPFVEKFLEHFNVKYEPDPNKSQNIQLKPQNNLEKSIETLNQARTYSKIENAYKKFIDTAFTVPVMLQHDYQQFIFPFFVHLAFQLYQLDKAVDAEKFINKFRGIQPQQCQETIDRLILEKKNFKAPDFNIQMNQFALDDLMLNIEQWKAVLLSFIINTHINITVAPYSHDLLFIDMDQTATATKNPDFTNNNNNFGFNNNLNNMFNDGFNSGFNDGFSNIGFGENNNNNKEEIAVMDPISEIDYMPPQFSVLFHPEALEKQPSIKQTEKGVYLTQALPDVAHIIAYNHNNRISDLKVSPCARLLAMAQDSSVVISSLDSTTGVNNANSSTLINHAGKVLTVDYSKDSQYIVSGGMDCQIKVAHLEAFRPLAKYKNHIEPILNVAWDYRSAYFAGASQDRTVSMWSLRSPTLLRLFLGHTLPVTNVVFSRDNSSILTCSNDLTLRIWDVGSAKEKIKFHCGRSIPLSIDVHPNNTLVACGCENGTVMLWDSAAGKRLWAQNPFETRITDVKFTSDGSLLIGSAIDGSLCAFNLKNENGEVVMNTKAYASTIDSITITKQNLVCTTGRSLRGGILI